MVGSVNRGRRAAWWAIAAVAAAAGVQLALAARHDAESFDSTRPVLVFGSVLVLLAVIGYALHRTVAKAPPDEARRQAALDTVVAGIAGPMLWLAIVLVQTLEECSFGPGC
jgi:drug/metabolite transporter (DMT)-like permease